MEDDVAYGGSAQIERVSVTEAQELARQSRPAPARGELAPDDLFERQAQATISQYAALRRELANTRDTIDRMHAESATLRAQVEELTRANIQLEQRLQASLVREGTTQEQIGWLKGLMTSAAAALTEGLGRSNQRLPASFDETRRPRDPRVGVYNHRERPESGD